MKKFLLLCLLMCLTGCMEMPYQQDTPDREAISFYHTEFFQKLRNEALEKKYQEREEKYNIRDAFKNIYYREENVPHLFM